MTGEAALRPVILIGAARSGTTLLAEEILARLPGFRYWGEPHYVWRYGHAFRPWDRLRPEDATPRVVTYIRRRFQQFATERDAKRVVEKTPANCLRVAFIHRVFPEAQFIHLIRDGRDVAISAAKEWRGHGQGAYDSVALRTGPAFRQVWRGIRTWARFSDRVRDWRSLLGVVASLPRAAAFILRRTCHPTWLPWGPRIPGLWAMRLSHGLLECCALQWAWCVHCVESERTAIADGQWLELRYEKLLRDPLVEIQRVADYLEARTTRGEQDRIASRIVRQDLPKWPHQLSEQEIKSVEGCVGSTLRMLGYPLSSELRRGGRAELG